MSIISSDSFPYIGLRSFTESDAQSFFGRERVVKKLVKILLSREPRFLALLGAPGSGKSSTVFGGLLPILRKDTRWLIANFRPGWKPFETLVYELLSLLGSSISQTDLLIEATKLASALQAGDLSLIKVIEHMLAMHDEVPKLLLIFDQFEELLVMIREDIRQTFVFELAELLESSLPVTVLLVLRDDFYSQFVSEFPLLTDWLEQGLINVSPNLTQEEIRAIIASPANAIGLGIEEELVDTICADISDSEKQSNSVRSTELPALQYLLYQLWVRRNDKGITLEAYQEIGGIAEVRRIFMKRNVKIFLCHSSTDKAQVRKLYERLSSDGFDVWLDEEKLVGGQEWESEIRKEVRNSHVVIVCLSKNSVSKVGYVQKEIRFALDVALEQPDSAIYIIPLRLEDCDVPERLRHWQWVDIYKPTGYERLLQALNVREQQIKK